MTKRLTYKYMMEWLQETFDRLEIDWEPFDMFYTRLRGADYERGAPVYIISIRSKKNPSLQCEVLVHDWLKEMQRELDTGKYKLHWEIKNRVNLDNSEITLKKI